MHPLPVVVLSALTRDLLEPVELSITFGLPNPVFVRHELDAAAGTVTRVVSDASGLVEREVVPLDHTCLSCALRHEIVPTLTRLAQTRRWSSIALSLPPATLPLPLVEAIAGMARVSAPVRRAIRVASILTVVEAGSLVADLFGDDLLRERDDVRHAGDVRAVGEVLIDAVEYADVLVLAESATRPDALALALLDEFRRADSQVCLDPAELSESDLLEPPQRAGGVLRPESRLPAWVPAGVRPGEGDRVYDATSPAARQAGIWTLFLDTWRPFHPERLMRNLESIGGQGYRGRGCFWLPTHPNSQAVWSGAGGQLGIGTARGVPTRGPRTRLVITGIDDRADDVRRDLEGALMTDRELAAGLAQWAGRADGFDPWLGDRRTSA